MRLVLGTVQFGLPYGIANPHGQVSIGEAKAILKHAEASGLDMLDTAIAYGDSERRLGEIGIGQWQVVSKLPAVPDGNLDVAAWVSASVASSLQRLGIVQLYGLLLHSPAQLLGEQGGVLYAALSQLKSCGLVKKIGVSIYAPDELTPLCERFSFDMVQVPFSVIDRRLHDSGWLSRLARQGVEVHARSVFLQGLLLMHPAARPAKFMRWQSLWEHWQRWLSDAALTPLQACLRYALSQQEIDRVVVGVDSLRQLEEILRAVHGDLPEVPADLTCGDPDLINPSRWQYL